MGNFAPTAPDGLVRVSARSGALDVGAVQANIQMMSLATCSPAAPNDGDFRTLASGNYVAATTWEMFQGGAWVPAATAPGPNPSGAIMVCDSHSVAMSAGTTSFDGPLAVETNGALVGGAGTIMEATADVVIDGALHFGGGFFFLQGVSFTNNGLVGGTTFRFDGGAQTLTGFGEWSTLQTLVVSPSANVTLANDISLAVPRFTISAGGQVTLANNTLTIDGTAGQRFVLVDGIVANPGLVRTEGSVSLDPNGGANGGSFNAPLTVGSGQTSVTPGASMIQGPIQIDPGAILGGATGTVLTSAGRRYCRRYAHDGKRSISLRRVHAHEQRRSPGEPAGWGHVPVSRWGPGAHRSGVLDDPAELDHRCRLQHDPRQ